MSFDISDDLAAIFDPDEGPAESATYTTPGGAGQAVHVLVVEAAVRVDLASGEILDQSDAVVFWRSEVSKPVEGSRVVVPSRGTFLLASPEAEGKHTVKMLARKVA